MLDKHTEVLLPLILGWEDMKTEYEARDRVIRAAMEFVDKWRVKRVMAPDVARAQLQATWELCTAVDALRSLDADRGVRDPSTPGKQEPDTEQAHGQAVRPGGQS